MTTNDIVQRLSGQLSEMRRRFSIQRLAVFGSAARDQLTDGSDIDILVVFQGTATFDGGHASTATIYEQPEREARTSEEQVNNNKPICDGRSE